MSIHEGIERGPAEDLMLWTYYVSSAGPGITYIHYLEALETIRETLHLGTRDCSSERVGHLPVLEVQQLPIKAPRGEYFCFLFLNQGWQGWVLIISCFQEIMTVSFP